MAHQDEDPRNLLIVAVGLGSIVTLVGAMFGLYSYYAYLRGEWQQERIFGRTNPQLTAQRASEDKVLSGYAYLSPDKTRARIPINDAMKLLAQRGRDAIPSIQPAAPAASSAAAPAPAGSAPAEPTGDKPKDEKKDEKKDVKKDKKDEKKDKKDKDKKDNH